MKIIHSADWHLGRIFLQMRLLDEQRYLLEKLADEMRLIQPDLFILAGDVFDKVYPGQEAIDLFGHFLNRLYNETSAAIVIIAGNHDSGALINYGGILQSRKRVLVSGTLEQMAGEPLVIDDAQGKVAVSALPFADVFAARQYFNDKTITSVEDVLQAQLAEARSHVTDKMRWIVVAHSFVQGCSSSESEQSLDRIGGIETVPPSLFDGAHYVALGHLHRRQKIGGMEHIRYSGSLMRYGFDELDKQKSIVSVDMDQAGAVQINHWPLIPQRDLRVLEGYFDDLLEGGKQDDGNCEDYIKVRLLDQHRILEAVGRLREIYPNIVQLEWGNRESLNSGTLSNARKNIASAKPEQLFANFFEDVTGKDLESDLEADLKTALGDLS